MREDTTNLTDLLEQDRQDSGDHQEPHDQERDTPAPEVGHLDDLDAELETPEPLEPEPEAPDYTTGRKPHGLDAVSDFLYSLESAGSGNTVEVRRAKRGGGPLEYVQKVASEFFDLEELRLTYGGGKYQLTVRNGQGDYLFQRTVEIAGRSKQPKVPDEDDRPPARTDSTLQLIERLSRRVEDIADRVRNHPQEAQSKSAFELALALSEHTRAQTAPFLEALLERNKGGSKSEDYVEVLLKGIELAKDLQPPSDPMMGVVSQLAVPLLTQLAANQAQTQGAPPVPTEATQNPPSSHARPTWQVMLAPWLDTLQKWASRDKDPAKRADFVLDELPEQGIQIVGEQLLKGEAFLAEFFQRFPETRTYESWYRTFWAQLSEGIEWEIDESYDPAHDEDDQGTEMDQE